MGKRILVVEDQEDNMQILRASGQWDPVPKGEIPAGKRPPDVTSF